MSNTTYEGLMLEKCLNRLLNSQKEHVKYKIGRVKSTLQ